MPRLHYGFRRERGLLEQTARRLQTHRRHEFRGRLAGIVAERTDEAALAHRGAPCQRADAQIGGKILLAPELDLLDGGNRGELRPQLGRELRLAAGALEEQDEIARDLQGKVAAVVFLEQRQREVDGKSRQRTCQT